MANNLPISWNYFFVAMSQNIPSLSWSTQYDRGTLFEVQGSYDGFNFQSIKKPGISQGIYKVQLNQGDKLIAKEKLVKQ